MGQTLSNQTKTEIIHLRIRAEEKEQIKAKAKAAGMSISEYIRYTALNADIFEIPDEVRT